MPGQGWCPSTYRIHLADDGGLARIRVPGGRLEPRQLTAVATAARELGNGLVDITTRANVQVRGLDAGASPALQALLHPVGLVAPTAELEDRRNVLASPAAGLADEVLDVRPVVRSVVAALDALGPAIDVPHKFGVLLDGGGCPSLRQLAFDLNLGARQLHGVTDPVFEVALGRPLDAGSETVMGIAVDDAGALAAAAARLCTDPPDGGPPGRLADVVERMGEPAIRQALGRSVPLSPIRPLPLAPDHGPTAWLDVQSTHAPVTAVELAALAQVLVDAGIAEVRLTPWRSVVIPSTDHRVVEALTSVGWTSTAKPAVTTRHPLGATA